MKNNWNRGRLAAIRQQNPAALAFVSNGNGGVDVSQLPLRLPNGDLVPNVVYTMTVSPQRPPGADGDSLSTFADLHPVFASQWSDEADNPSRMSPYAAEFFGRHQIGWAAANWNADPRLIMDAANQVFTATAWGTIAMRAAKLPVRPHLKAF